MSNIKTWPSTYKTWKLISSKLWCRCNFNFWIASDLIWKSIPFHRTESLDDALAGTQSSSIIGSKVPQTLGEVKLEINLLKGLPHHMRDSIPTKHTAINELGLTDDAFRPKLYSIRIEKGNFKTPSYIGYEEPFWPRCELRLLFDVSPYPPEHEWRDPSRGASDCPFWAHKEFVARELSDAAKKVGPMNEHFSRSSWNACIVS